MISRLLAAVACAALLWSQNADVEKAWKLASEGQSDQAIRILEGVIQNGARDADARLLLGSLLVEKGDRAGAIEQLSEAVRLRPQSAEAQNALGEAYNRFGDTKSARAPFEKAIALNPGFGAAQTNLGLILVQAGELQSAGQHLDRAIQILGHTADAAYPHYLRAKVYSAQNDAQKAVTHLQEAVSLRPDFAEAWSDLGLARKTVLDEAGALAAYKRAVELKPTDAVAQYRLGAEYLRAGQAHAAVEHLEQAYRFNPEDQSTLNSLQSALRQDGQSKEASSIRQKLAELLQKKDQERQNALAAVRVNNEGANLEKAGDLRGAVQKYREALNLNPEHVGIRVNYAVALLRLAQWTEGLTQLHEALRRDPGNAQIQAAMKDALAQAPPESVPKWSDADRE
ncbi:MAG TPA: tetratricopeptide repeat protein [Bryobacteraceae bacterium]|jgi:Flp pilus assembly protein TadD